MSVFYGANLHKEKVGTMLRKITRLLHSDKYVLEASIENIASVQKALDGKEDIHPLHDTLKKIIADKDGEFTIFSADEIAKIEKVVGKSLGDGLTRFFRTFGSVKVRGFHTLKSGQIISVYNHLRQESGWPSDMVPLFQIVFNGGSFSAQFGKKDATFVVSWNVSDQTPVLSAIYADGDHAWEKLQKMLGATIPHGSDPEDLVDVLIQIFAPT